MAKRKPAYVNQLEKLGFEVMKLDGDPSKRHTLGCGCIMDGKGRTVEHCSKCQAFLDSKKKARR